MISPGDRPAPVSSSHWLGRPSSIVAGPPYVAAEGDGLMIRSLLAVAPEIAACVGEGREPTVQELGRLADRVRTEIWGSQPTFSWAREPREAAIRIASFRVASAALIGQLPDAVVAAD